MRLADTGVIAPTAYDMLSARIIASTGFDAVFCSGYGQAASALGKPDDGSLTLATLADRVSSMCETVSIPVLVDADTGFGDPAQTTRTLVRSGASAVMIEDQIDAKRCGHVPGKQVVSREDMKMRLAGCIAGADGALIIARTDAVDPLGIDEALARGREYAALGADVVFVEAPSNLDDLARIPRELPCPTMVNIIPGGRTPALSVPQLRELGFALVVFGLLDLMLATAALIQGFTALAQTQDIRRLEVPLTSFSDLNALTGLTSSLERR